MTLLESVETLFSFAAGFKNAEYIRLCMDVQTSAIETLRALGRAEEENRELKRRLWQLEDELSAYKRGDKVSESDITYHEDGAYITVRGRGNTKYCENCWSINRQLIHVQKNYDGGFECPICKTRFGGIL